MNPFDRVWKEEENDKLRELYLAGMSVRDIAIKLGRTEGAVRSRASVYLGLRRPRKIIKRRAVTSGKAEYLDCMPNPFHCRSLKKAGFDINFYRKI